LFAVAMLTWYGRHGAGLFANARVVRIVADGDGYSVSCLAGRDSTVIGQITVSGGLPPVDALPRPDSVSGTTISWESVYPFGDDIRAILLTVRGATALLCDSTIFKERPDGARSRFWENLDLLVVPSADRGKILPVRTQCRPRLRAIIPPCDDMPPIPNIICREEGVHDFEVKRGRFYEKSSYQ
jgi:hypothetical protein